MNQEYVLDLLNQALKRDPKAMTDLVGNRVPCNKALADHPTIQCGTHTGTTTVGILGILNGLFPELRTRIAAVYGEAKDGEGLGPVLQFRIDRRGRSRMNDLIRLAMEQAANAHGSQDRSFNSRRFWEAFSPMAGISITEAPIGFPLIVRAMLTGRPDCELLPKAGTFRIVGA